MLEIDITHTHIHIPTQKGQTGSAHAFSPITLARFQEIDAQIKAHENTIAYAQAVIEGNLDLRKIGCTPEIRGYQRTPEDEARSQRTLQNIQQQIDLLAYEREVLRRYGR